MLGVICIALFIALILLRVPVCASLGIATFTGMLAGGYPLSMTIMSLQATLESVNYLPIIFFILMGNIANSTGLSERIFRFATDMVGHLRGGLAQSNVMASMLFAGMSGSGIADCAGLGIVEMKAMTDYGYGRGFSAAVTAASAVVGPIIPPSISLVIYGVLANVSITRVLLGGLVPGLFIGLVLMGLIWFLTAGGKVDAPLSKKLSVKEKALSFRRSFSALLAPVILLSGFALGAVSPSEAGGLAIFYVVLIAAFRRRVSFRRVFSEGVLGSIITISQILFILALASAFAWLLTREQVYVHLADIILVFCGDSQWKFWLVVNVFYLANGLFVPGIATMVITVPLFAPLLPVYHIDPIQFGVVIIFNDMIGMITPPVGSGIFVMLSVGKVRYEELVKNLAPFVFVLLLALFVLVLIPEITTLFPDLILGPLGGGS